MNSIRHLAIIMDGNGRWAERRGFSRTRGHLAGARRAFEQIEWLAKSATKHDLTTVTLFGFSTENWGRPEPEVAGLMKLFAHSLRSRLPSFKEHSIRVFVIGRRERLPFELCDVVSEIESLTSNNSNLNLVIAIDYSGQWDILQAIAKSHVDSSEFESNLCTARFGPVDLMIRTGGERRLSNFLLWPLAYAELHFSDLLWPDFSCEDLAQIFARFQDIERRFGRLKMR